MEMWREKPWSGAIWPEEGRDLRNNVSHWGIFVIVDIDSNFVERTVNYKKDKERKKNKNNPTHFSDYSKIPRARTRNN
jgi:hypothetical protein